MLQTLGSLSVEIAKLSLETSQSRKTGAFRVYTYPEPSFHCKILVDRRQQAVDDGQ
jgi:hypothetical protein